MSDQKIIKELRRILKMYHYKSDIEHMSPDVATSLKKLIRTIIKGDYYISFESQKDMSKWFNKNDFIISKALVKLDKVLKEKLCQAKKQ